MNKLSLAFITVTSLFLSLNAFSKRSAPKFNFALENQVESNINFSAPETEKNIHTTKLKIGVKLKKKIKRGLYLIDLPSMDANISSNSVKKIRGYNLSNTLIGLYIHSREHIFTSSSTAGYTNSTHLNDGFLIQENHFFHMSLDFSHDWAMSKTFKLNTLIGTKIRKFSTLTDTSDSLNEQNDDWKQFIKLKSSIMPSKVITFGPIFSLTQKLYKNKRALTKTGAQGGTEAKGSRQYKYGSFVKLKYSLAQVMFKIEGVKNIDIANGADNYSGTNYEVSSKNKLGLFPHKIRVNYKDQVYETQQVDTQTQELFATLYKTTMTNIINHITLPSSWTGYYTINLEHKFQKLSSNRSDETYTNHTYKIGINFTY